MLPSQYEFFNPVKIISGHKSLENIPYELSLMESKRPLIITDQGVVGAGLSKILIDALADSDIVVGALYEDTPPDSSNIVVNEIAEIYRKQKCDSIIALGGGSVMDTAKGVNIVVTEETDDLMKYVGAERLTKKMKPFVAIPTTSGTGSEVTLAAVINNIAKGYKMAFTSYTLFPDVAILDTRMTLTVPPKVTAATGMDALTHAVEAYSCIQKNPLSDAYAFASIDLSRKYFLETIKNGKDKEARLAMANASLLAGTAFSNSMCGIVHSIGHATGGVCHVPHGVAMAIFLPFGMEYNMKACAPYYAELLLALAGAEVYASTPAESRATRAVKAVRELNANLNKLSGMPITLEQAGVKKDQLQKIAETAIDDGAITFNPLDADVNDFLEILKAAYS